MQLYSREIEEAHWQENLRRWNENDKKWDQNEKRWEEYRKNRKQDREDILNILLSYDISISKQLGNQNAEKMRKIV